MIGKVIINIVIIVGLLVYSQKKASKANKVYKLGEENKTEEKKTENYYVYDEKEKEFNQKTKEGKKTGCLKIVLAFIAIVIILNLVPDIETENKADAKLSPLEKIFKENNLGKIKKSEVSEWTNGKILTFEANKIKYKAFLNKDESIYQLFVGKGKAFPVYDVTQNDTTVDEEEVKIIKRMQNFLEKSENTYSGLIPEMKNDLKQYLNFPDTFSCEKIILFDMGKYYILNITFNSKNAFGMKISNVAKYQMDFENNTFTLIEIL